LLRATAAALVWLLLAQLPCLGERGYTRFRYEHSKIITADPYPLAPGQVQLEIDYAYFNSSGRFDNNWTPRRRPEQIRNVALLTTSMGIARGIDASLGILYKNAVDFSRTPRSGDAFSTILASSTMLLHYDDQRRFAVAYIPLFSFPLQDDEELEALEILPRSFAWDNRLVLSKDFATNWTVNYDIGYIWPFGRDVGHDRGIFTTSGAIGYQYFSWLQPVFEMLYIHEFRDGANDRDRFSVITGMVMPVSSQMRVELGVLQNVAGRNLPKLTSLIANFTVVF